MGRHPSESAISTAMAARACIQHIQRSGWACEAPLPCLAGLVDQLRKAPSTRDHLWVLDDRADWATPGHGVRIAELARQCLDAPRPWLHLTRGMSRSRLAALAAPSNARGIILNDIARHSDALARHLPAWSSTDLHCTPFDPACGEEAKAILAGALDELYVQGATGVIYMDLQDGPGEGLACDRSDAYRGMYRIYDVIDLPPAVRLLGSGPMLREVRAAADRLLADWGIIAQVWSCPSYTRLARDAAACAASQAPEPCHLHACLGSAAAPVVAVTAYAEYVAAQLKPHLAAPFIALGSDSLGPGQPLNRDWIVVAALQTLVRNGTLYPEVLRQAWSCYQLA
ncbi:transketolase-like TK C-terminal-containing protein [Pseudomonas sp. KNUC1026]|uniref:transketolase-like TK C-terminal-containing protein n=1 Tax=Pseudomonas sp. KNUC1026 TaxID=2893890 RepID=UPI001F229580|nr:pyruvate dehydrogenase [Pseudomonas sp. KNUC1026]UFH51142.1 pyruvate dehydrogenase [Pseudomonas sp. KNUC1026]